MHALQPDRNSPSRILAAAPWAFAALGSLLFLALRFQRIDAPSGPQADEGVYLHVARHLADSGQSLASWYFIHRGGLHPEGVIPYRQSIVQPGLPLLLTAGMDPVPAGPVPAGTEPSGPVPAAGDAAAAGADPFASGRSLIFLMAALSLPCLLFAAYRIGADGRSDGRGVGGTVDGHSGGRADRTGASAATGAWAAAGAALWTGMSFSQIEYGSLIHTETPMSLATYASLAALLLLLPGRPAAAGFVSGALAGVGLWFRTNGVFLPLALACVLLLRRKEFPRAGWMCLLGSALVMGPLLAYSALFLGGPLASDSGDILWAASLEDFRSLNAGPITAAHLVQAVGWTGFLLRPLHGAWELLQRLWEADHGRTAPLLLPALAGLWLRRRNVAVQALAIGSLPTLAVTVWVSPISWCDRYLHFLFPLAYALAGTGLAAGIGWAIGKLPRARPPDQDQGRRWSRIPFPAGLAVPGMVLLLTLPFLPPHRFLQRRLEALRVPEASAAEFRELDERLAEAGKDRRLFLVGTGFSRYHWRRTYPGANRPASLPADSLGPAMRSVLKVEPTHLVLERREEEDLSPRDRAFLANRLRFRAGSFAVYGLDDPERRARN